MLRVFCEPAATALIDSGASNPEKGGKGVFLPHALTSSPAGRFRRISLAPKSSQSRHARCLSLLHFSPGKATNIPALPRRANGEGDDQCDAGHNTDATSSSISSLFFLASSALSRAVLTFSMYLSISPSLRCCASANAASACTSFLLASISNLAR